MSEAQSLTIKGRNDYPGLTQDFQRQSIEFYHRTPPSAWDAWQGHTTSVVFSSQSGSRSQPVTKGFPTTPDSNLTLHYLDWMFYHLLNSKGGMDRSGDRGWLINLIIKSLIPPSEPHPEQTDQRIALYRARDEIAQRDKEAYALPAELPQLAQDVRDYHWYADNEPYSGRFFDSYARNIKTCDGLHGLKQRVTSLRKRHPLSSHGK